MTDTDEDKEPLVKHTDEKELEHTHEKKKAQETDKWYQSMLWKKLGEPLTILCVTTGIIVLCYLYCVPCLFGIIIFSFCFCISIPILNYPLWIAILILLIQGYTLSNKPFTLTWQGAF